MPEHESDRHGIAGAADARTVAGRYQSDGFTGLVLLGMQASMDGGRLVQSVSRGAQLCFARPVTGYDQLATREDPLSKATRKDELGLSIVSL